MRKTKHIKLLLSMLLMFAVPFGLLTGSSLFNEDSTSSLAVTKNDTKRSNASTTSIEGCSEDHPGNDWTELTSEYLAENYQDMSAGAYYLGDAISWSSDIYFFQGGDITICLNGMKISDCSFMFFVENTTSIAIHDCSEDGTGEIYGGSVCVSGSGTENISIEINITGGTISGNNPVIIIDNNNLKNSSIELNISGGSIVSNGYSTILLNEGDTELMTNKINISGGTISGGVYGIYLSNEGIENTSATELNISGGIITAESSATYSSDTTCAIFVDNYPSDSSVDINISGGYINSYGSSYSYGLYTYKPDNTTTTIDGGYHNYKDLSLGDTNFVVNAGYFIDDLASDIAQYVPSTSIAFDPYDVSFPADLSILDSDYDQDDYPYAVYVNGTIEPFVPGTICVESDIKKYILWKNGDDTFNGYIYSNTFGTGTDNNGLTFSEAGTYQVSYEYNEFVSNDGRVPKEYFGEYESTVEVTIDDHNLELDYSYDGTCHWYECTNPYCDVKVSEHEEHSLNQLDEENDPHKYGCTKCEYTTTTEHDYTGSKATNNGDNHSYVCTTDGCNETTPEDHSYESITAHTEICKCGASITSGHNLSDIYYDYGKDYHSQKCVDCNELIQNVHTYDDVSAHTTECDCGSTLTTEHNYDGADYVDDGDDGHYQVCTVDDCEERNYSLHEYTTPDASNPHYNSCVCNHSYSTEHNYDGADYVSDGDNGHYQECTICSSETFPSDHDFSGGWVETTEEGYDEERTCTYCKYTEYRTASSDDPSNPTPSDPSTSTDPNDEDPSGSDPSTSDDPTNEDPTDNPNTSDSVDSNDGLTSIIVPAVAGVVLVLLLVGDGTKAVFDSNKDNKVKESTENETEEN